MAPVAQWSAVGEDGQSTIPGGVAGLASPEELRGALESPARHGLLLLLSRQESEGQQWGQQWTQWGSGTFCPPNRESHLQNCRGAPVPEDQLAPEVDRPPP